MKSRSAILLVFGVLTLSNVVLDAAYYYSGSDFGGYGYAKPRKRYKRRNARPMRYRA